METQPETELIEEVRIEATFEIIIEGKPFTWHQETILTEEIAMLGGWDAGHGVIMVDHDNNERVLEISECIQIRSGVGFGKRVRWKRG